MAMGGVKDTVIAADCDKCGEVTEGNALHVITFFNCFFLYRPVMCALLCYFTGRM